MGLITTCTTDVVWCVHNHTLSVLANIIGILEKLGALLGCCCELQEPYIMVVGSRAMIGGISEWDESIG